MGHVLPEVPAATYGYWRSCISFDARARRAIHEWSGEWNRVPAIATLSSPVERASWRVLLVLFLYSMLPSIRHTRTSASQLLLCSFDFDRPRLLYISITPLVSRLHSAIGPFVTPFISPPPAYYPHLRLLAPL